MMSKVDGIAAWFAVRSEHAENEVAKDIEFDTES